MVKIFISAKTNLNAIDNDGKSPLIIVSEKGCLDIVKLLINAGANCNILAKNGYSAYERQKL